jgi:hypothetical protein
MSPLDSAAFDIALDHFVPGKMRVGHAAIAEDAQMNDELHTRICGRVNNVLALMHHRHRIAGCEKKTINSGQRSRKGQRRIEIEMNGFLAFTAPDFNLLTIT